MLLTRLAGFERDFRQCKLRLPVPEVDCGPCGRHRRMWRELGERRCAGRIEVTFDIRQASRAGSASLVFDDAPSPSFILPRIYLNIISQPACQRPT